MLSRFICPHNAREGQDVGVFEILPVPHLATIHYQTWRDAVAEMMAEPRSSVKYDNVFPDDEGWG